MYGLDIKKVEMRTLAFTACRGLVDIGNLIAMSERVLGDVSSNELVNELIEGFTEAYFIFREEVERLEINLAKDKGYFGGGTYESLVECIEAYSVAEDYISLFKDYLKGLGD